MADLWTGLLAAGNSGTHHDPKPLAKILEAELPGLAPILVKRAADTSGFLGEVRCGAVPWC